MPNRNYQPRTVFKSPKVLPEDLHVEDRFANLEDRLLSSPSSDCATPSEDGEQPHERDWRQYKNVKKRMRRERKREAQKAYEELEEIRKAGGHADGKGKPGEVTGEEKDGQAVDKESPRSPGTGHEMSMQYPLPPKRPRTSRNLTRLLGVERRPRTSAEVSGASDASSKETLPPNPPRSSRPDDGKMVLPNSPEKSPSPAPITQSSIMAWIMDSPDPDIQITGTIPETTNGLITLEQLSESDSCSVRVIFPGDSEGLELSRAVEDPVYLRGLIKYFKTEYCDKLKPGTRVDFPDVRRPGRQTKASGEHAVAGIATESPEQGTRAGTVPLRDPGSSEAQCAGLAAACNGEK